MHRRTRPLQVAAQVACVLRVGESRSAFPCCATPFGPCPGFEDGASGRRDYRGAVFSWYTFLATPNTPVKVEVNNGGESGKLVMTSPHLNGYTKDNRPYSMTAAKATQDAKNSGAITLEGISAELPVGEKGMAKVEATSGVYDNANGRLQLDKDFIVTTDDGLRAVLRSADVNLKSGQITTDKPVDIRSGSTHILADSMQVKDNGKVLIFENKVRMTVDGSVVSPNKVP